MGPMIFMVVALVALGCTAVVKVSDNRRVSQAKARLRRNAKAAEAIEAITFADLAAFELMEKVGIEANDPRWREFRLSEMERKQSAASIRAKLREWGYYPSGNGKNERMPEEKVTYEMFVQPEEPWQKGDWVSKEVAKIQVESVLDVVWLREKDTDEPFTRRRIHVKAAPSEVRKMMDAYPGILPAPRAVA